MVRERGRVWKRSVCKRESHINREKKANGVAHQNPPDGYKNAS